MCRTGGRSYRFEIPISYEDVYQHYNKPYYVVGISTQGTANSVLGYSGNFRFPSIPDTHVVGFMDNFDPATSKITGWACQTGLVAPIDVQLYLGGPRGSAEGRFIKNVVSDKSSEVAVSKTCGTQGRNYRFEIPITDLEAKKYQTDTIYLYGISMKGTPDMELTNSGTANLPDVSDILSFAIRGNAILNKIHKTIEMQLMVAPDEAMTATT